MRIRLRAINLRHFAEFLHQLVGASHRARERATDADVELARSGLTEAGVEGHYFHDLDGLDIEMSRYPLDSRSGDEAETMLHHVKKRQHRRALLIVRIVRDSLCCLAVEFVVGAECWVELRARSLG